MTNFQAFAIVYGSALGVLVLFAALHTLHHVLGRMAGDWLDRRRGVAGLRPLSQGRKPR